MNIIYFFKNEPKAVCFHHVCLYWIYWFERFLLALQKIGKSIFNFETNRIHKLPANQPGSSYAIAIVGLKLGATI
ncbi:MAG: hypothetical protein NMK33_05505 [Candidatus Cardinium sp.]|nr:MAG: hypothetical protein NMK33_05505 [Candidatus Cardinium sp.]